MSTLGTITGFMLINHAAITANIGADSSSSPYSDRDCYDIYKGKPVRHYIPNAFANSDILQFHV